MLIPFLLGRPTLFMGWADFIFLVDHSKKSLTVNYNPNSKRAVLAADNGGA
jgi:hypothetical protein